MYGNIGVGFRETVPLSGKYRGIIRYKYEDGLCAYREAGGPGALVLDVVAHGQLVILVPTYIGKTGQSDQLKGRVRESA